MDINKSDIIIRKFFSTFAQIIVQSRFNFQKDEIKKESKWFNIRLNDIQRIEEDPVIYNYKKIPIPDFLPLIIDIYLDISPCLSTQKVYIKNEDEKDSFVEIDASSSINNNNNTYDHHKSSTHHREKKKILLLERWRLSLNSTEINKKLESSITYKKAIIFFRTLYMQIRMMPTYKLLKRLRMKNKELDPSEPRPHIIYKISNAIGQLSQNYEEIGFDAPFNARDMTEKSFGNVETVRGVFSIYISYRKYCQIIFKDIPIQSSEDKQYQEYNNEDNITNELLKTLRPRSFQPNPQNFSPSKSRRPQSILSLKRNINDSNNNNNENNNESNYKIDLGKENQFNSVNQNSNLIDVNEITIRNNAKKQYRDGLSKSSSVSSLSFKYKYMQDKDYGNIAQNNDNSQNGSNKQISNPNNIKNVLQQFKQLNISNKEFTNNLYDSIVYTRSRSSLDEENSNSYMINNQMNTNNQKFENSKAFNDLNFYKLNQDSIPNEYSYLSGSNTNMNNIDLRKNYNNFKNGNTMTILTTINNNNNNNNSNNNTKAPSLKSFNTSCPSPHSTRSTNSSFVNLFSLSDIEIDSEPSLVNVPTFATLPQNKNLKDNGTNEATFSNTNSITNSYLNHSAFKNVLPHQNLNYNEDLDDSLLLQDFYYSPQKSSFASLDIKRRSLNSPFLKKKSSLSSMQNNSNNNLTIEYHNENIDDYYNKNFHNENLYKSSSIKFNFNSEYYRRQSDSIIPSGNHHRNQLSSFYKYKSLNNIYQKDKDINQKMVSFYNSNNNYESGGRNGFNRGNFNNLNEFDFDNVRDFNLIQKSRKLNNNNNNSLNNKLNNNSNYNRHSDPNINTNSYENSNNNPPSISLTSPSPVPFKPRKSITIQNNSPPSSSSSSMNSSRNHSYDNISTSAPINYPTFSRRHYAAEANYYHYGSYGSDNYDAYLHPFRPIYEDEAFNSYDHYHLHPYSHSPRYYYNSNPNLSERREKL
ncbi:hypothetical protein BCR32DRAFT_272948 [Anaeromyces robustus]|uniref:Autophagy-related protein 13 n=1 Tax=Anaeromyces robustus TaxID=1754192 RepID=A0A1Y1VUY1_9FUNG|nr:hypothetical protein BCR32DRAFT_272948 [Anaeromyces robustus]|eukprot:ORX64826.1 hypothetical protein BCR32DRAFT_272948 [Anaeromyces robustus]